MKSIAELSKEINDNAKAKGFWDKPRNTGEMLMLIVSEVSEVMEADRKDRYARRVGFERDMEGFDGSSQEDRRFNMTFERCIKDTFEDELADAMIRIMDLAYSRGIDLQWHIEQKMKYNAQREHMHGKKY